MFAFKTAMYMIAIKRSEIRKLSVVQKIKNQSLPSFSFALLSSIQNWFLCTLEKHSWGFCLIFIRWWSILASLLIHWLYIVFIFAINMEFIYILVFSVFKTPLSMRRSWGLSGSWRPSISATQKYAEYTKLQREKTCTRMLIDIS